MGIGFTALVAQLTDAVPAGSEADLSGVVTTTSELAGVFGVAIFGTAYFALATTPAHAFTTVSFLLGLTAVLAAAAAYGSTRPKQQ